MCLKCGEKSKSVRIQLTTDRPISMRIINTLFENIYFTGCQKVLCHSWVSLSCATILCAQWCGHECCIFWSWNGYIPWQCSVCIQWTPCCYFQIHSKCKGERLFSSMLTSHFEEACVIPSYLLSLISSSTQIAQLVSAGDRCWCSG